jgi:hypothetical protein
MTGIVGQGIVACGHFLRRTLQISHARRAGEPSLLKYWAMLSGSIIGDSGEIKGVGLWLTGSALPWKALRFLRKAKGSRTTRHSRVAPTKATFPVPPDHARLMPTTIPAAKPAVRLQNNAPRIRTIFFFAPTSAQSPRQGMAAITSSSMASIFFSRSVY